MSKIKKLLTLEDLVKFCKEQNFSKFSSKDTGYQLSVQVPANFEVEDTAYQDNTLLFGKVKVFHIGPNRNGSSVTKEAAEKALSTIAYKPLLANFCEVDGIKDFTSHDVEFNDDGTVTYIEHQIGCFTADTPVIQYDETTEKEFVFAKVAIPREYTDACEIIERKNGTKISVELLVNEMNYSAKDDILELTDIIVQGCTCLGMNPETGENIEEGMQGARLDIADFSAENNSVAVDINAKLNDTLIETLSKLNDALDRFNDTNDSDKKGGNSTMDKFNELLDLYGLTADEIDFEVEGLDDDALTDLFTEKFGDAEEFKKNKCSNDNNSSNDDGNDDGTDNFADCGNKKMHCSINNETGTVKFELSFDEVRMALYGLINTNSDYDSYNWICEVYDDHFIYQNETYDDNGYSSKYYKQNYSKSNEDVALAGDPVEVFTEFVTESERTALDMIRSQYESLKAFKEKYDAEQLKAQKDAVLESVEYEEIKNTDEFKALISEADKYSLDELKVKADLLFADAMKKKFSFAAKPDEKHSVGIKLDAKPTKKSAYGNLFDN